jgi:RimJ/RimL family protein N-acetyltransferase
MAMSSSSASTPDPALRSERLSLSPLGPAHLDALWPINADPEVMAFIGAPLTREASADLIERAVAHWERHGFGLFAATERDSGELIGWIGLVVPSFEARFTPCVEIGWRLARQFWGRGLASEGARAVRAHAHRTLDIEEIVSFTAATNIRSRAVMERVGLTRDEASDFDHPNVPDGDPLRPHVLYRGRANESASR